MTLIDQLLAQAASLPTHTSAEGRQIVLSAAQFRILIGPIAVAAEMAAKMAEAGDRFTVAEALCLQHAEGDQSEEAMAQIAERDKLDEEETAARRALREIGRKINAEGPHRHTLTAPASTPSGVLALSREAKLQLGVYGNALVNGQQERADTANDAARKAIDRLTALAAYAPTPPTPGA